MVFYHLFNLYWWTLLPLFHKFAELIRFRKPKNGMYMIRHDHKSRTFSILLVKFWVQYTDNNSLSHVVNKKATSFIAREGYVMSMTFFIICLSFWHAERLNDDHPFVNLLVLRTRTNKLSGLSLSISFGSSQRWWWKILSCHDLSYSNGNQNPGWAYAEYSPTYARFLVITLTSTPSASQ